MSKYWEPCPRCGSNRVQTMGKAFWFLLFLGAGGVLFWLGFLIFPLLFIGPLLILASPLAFVLPKTNSCKDCKNSWKVTKQKEIQS